MKLTPQPAIDSRFTAAVEDHCDCVQFKYTGMWVRIEVSNNFLRIYDAKKREVETPSNFTFIDSPVCGTLIGNLLPGMEHIVAWDCWSVCTLPLGEHCAVHSSLETYPYRDRYAVLAGLTRQLAHPHVSLVRNYPLSSANDLWENPVPFSCGLIFRKSTDTTATPIRMARQYREVPSALA